MPHGDFDRVDFVGEVRKDRWAFVSLCAMRATPRDESRPEDDADAMFAVQPLNSEIGNWACTQVERSASRSGLHSTFAVAVLHRSCVCSCDWNSQIPPCSGLGHDCNTPFECSDS